MTVGNVTPVTRITAIAAQTVFPFTFRCDDAGDLLVYVGDVAQGGFAVALNADQDASPGGTVTLAAQAVGALVTIERDTVTDQVTDIGRYANFSATLLESVLDRATMLSQEIKAGFARTFRASRAAMFRVQTPFELPIPVNGKAIGWADAGGGLSKLETLTIPVTVNWRGAYSGIVDYAVSDAVSYLGSSYVMHTDAGAGTLPTDASKWMQLAAKGDVGPAGADGAGAIGYHVASLNRDAIASGDGMVGLVNGGTSKLTFVRHKEVGTSVTSNNADTLTAAVTGTYRIRGYMSADPNGATAWANGPKLEVFKNGIPLRCIAECNTGDLNIPGNISLAGETVEDLVATDTIDLRIVNTGSTGGLGRIRVAQLTMERIA